MQSVGTSCKIIYMNTTHNNTDNPTYEEVLIAHLTVTYHDCLAAAENATNSTDRHYWKAKAKEYAERIARRVEILNKEVK